MFDIFVTRTVFQLVMSPLNAVAVLNMPDMLIDTAGSVDKFHELRE
jgi:hypothetical protein